MRYDQDSKILPSHTSVSLCDSSFLHRRPFESQAEKEKHIRYYCTLSINSLSNLLETYQRLTVWILIEIFLMINDSLVESDDTISQGRDHVQLL